jgi:hypothetical protein
MDETRINEDGFNEDGILDEEEQGPYDLKK